MQARDVMTRSVVTVRTPDSVHHSAESTATDNVTSVAVLDEDDRTVGVVRRWKVDVDEGVVSIRGPFDDVAQEGSL